MTMANVSLRAVPVRRLVVDAISGSKGGDMEHTHRQINERASARDQAIICYLYGKRG
jgi:hypothetical protein